MATSLPAGLEPTQDDRTMATLAHALSMLGFIAPLVIFLMKRQSRFVSFHALQALLWHIAYMILVFGSMFIFLFIFLFTIIAHPMPNGAPPIGVFIAFPVVWLLLSAGGIINLVLAIVYAIKAGQGEWANYPIFGKMARKILKLAPNQTF